MLDPSISLLRERIDKAIVGKLINAKVNFGLGAAMKAVTTLISMII